MRQVSGIEHHLAVGQDGRGLSEVNHGRGEQADAGVAMVFVIPLEKLLTEGAAVLDAAEAIRELRAVFHGAEVAFRIGVVVGNIRSAVRLGDAQVGHQKGDRLGSHDPAAVGMDVELAGGDWCVCGRFPR